MLVLLLLGLGLIPISLWKLWAAALRGKGWKLTAKWAATSVLLRRMINTGTAVLLFSILKCTLEKCVHWNVFPYRKHESCIVCLHQWCWYKEGVKKWIHLSVFLVQSYKHSTVYTIFWLLVTLPKNFYKKKKRIFFASFCLLVCFLKFYFYFRRGLLVISWIYNKWHTDC